MKHHILLISTVGFLMFAPSVQHSIYGTDINSPVMQEHIVVISDDIIKNNVKEAIVSDMDLMKFANLIDIKVDKGIVTLSGVVDSSTVKSKIESKVTSVVGVKKVINNIEVKS
jgi:osmotically-inducible protein OsmY